MLGAITLKSGKFFKLLYLKFKNVKPVNLVTGRVSIPDD